MSGDRVAGITGGAIVSDGDIDAAVELLRRGELVAFPTETVYGLGADASSSAAVRRIFEAKGRPLGHPLIVHLADSDQLDRFGRDLSIGARLLAGAFWPGPLTLVVRRGDGICDEVTGGRPTVGLRVPDQPIALALLQRFGGPLAAPSANRFGRVSPTTADHVRADLGDDVALVLDGGPCVVGLESTIVEMVDAEPVILRHGAITADDLEGVLGRPVRRHDLGPSRASGMLASHYAPRCQVIVTLDRGEAERLAAEAVAPVEILDPGVAPEVWAHELYRWLRDADDHGLATLVVVAPPSVGIGAAVNDRLSKAAAPRP